MPKQIAIVGTGPAGLMAADVVASAGHEVHLYDKRPGPARKLFIAGSSGLNITNVLPLVDFVKHYVGDSSLWAQTLADFSPDAWIRFIEGQLAIKTFAGTSGRYFVENMKSVGLVRAWRKRLSDLGVQWHFGAECQKFELGAGGRINLTFTERTSAEYDAVGFALGGASYEPDEQPLRWPQMFCEAGIGFTPFVASNVGYQVEWKPEFLVEADGQPLKNIRVTSSRGERLGDIVITKYGVEGTPIYFVGTSEIVHIDLKPDLSKEQVLEKLRAVRENLAPLRRAKKHLNLSDTATALLFHHAPAGALSDLQTFASCLKAFPLKLGSPQPIEEAISSAGGIQMRELDSGLMLKKFPGVYAAGEMLDWDAPTGGFLIQGAVAQGFRVGNSILSRFSAGQ